MPEQNTHRFLQGKHVVVFGAGYVGGRLAKVALTAGAIVTVLTRNSTVAESLAAAGCEAVVADLATDDWHPRILPGDYILNTVSSGRSGLAGYQRSYVAGAHSILRWAKDFSDRGHLIYTGSTSVYPQGEGQTVDETAPVEASDERSAMLIEAEQIHQEWEGRSTILRLAGIYGPGRHYLLDQLRDGMVQFPVGGDRHLNLIHRDDIVGAVLAAWGTTSAVSNQIYNVVDDGRFTKNEIVTWLAEKLDHPGVSFDGIAVLGRRVGRPDRVFSNRRLRNELNWRPTYPTCREGYSAILEA